MLQRLCCFLVVSLLMFQVGSFGQEKQQFTYQNSRSNQGYNPGWSARQKIIFQTSIGPVQAASLSFSLKQPLQDPFYSGHLGVICKMELQFDKISPLPFRFRLGSLAYVNWMERKPNAIKPGL